MAPRTWICQRQSKGVKCGHVNLKRLQICEECGKKRPRTKPLAHRRVMKVPYPHWVDKFGEVCGICGSPPTPGKKLMRDHDHRLGYARGLLCWTCNHSLATWRDLEWHKKAVAYLERSLADREEFEALLRRYDPLQ